MSYHTPWTDAHEASLRNHVAASHLSYSGIASALNEEFGTHYSRQAAIGKASRLGLTNTYYAETLMRPRKPRKHQPYKPRPKRIPVFPPAEIIALQCSEIIPRNLTLLELDRDDCRWPYGEIPGVRFCGHGKFDGSSYCFEHFALSRRGTS